MNNVQFDGFELDTLRRQLLHRGVNVALAPLPLRLLVYLVEQRHRAVGRTELLDRLWPGVHVSPSALAGALKRLRRALREAGARHPVVETVRGWGLRFSGRVAPDPARDGATQPVPGRAPTRLVARRAVPLADESSWQSELLQAYASVTEDGLWCFEIDPPIRADRDEETVIDQIFERATLSFCNQRLAETYGYARSELLIGRPLTDFLIQEAPENIAGFRAVLRSSLQLKNVFSREVDRHGELRWIRNHIVGVSRAGEVIRFCGAQQDVTPVVDGVAKADAVGPRARRSARARSQLGEIARILAVSRGCIDRALAALAESASPEREAAEIREAWEEALDALRRLEWADVPR